MRVRFVAILAGLIGLCCLLTGAPATASPMSSTSTISPTTLHRLTTGAPVIVTIANESSMPRPTSTIHPTYAPSCVGEGCTYLDPVTQSNCSTNGSRVAGFTITKGAIDANLGTINLMYQHNCQANWAEADNLAAGVWIEVFNTEGEYVLYQPNFNWGYTSMVNGQPSAGVCIYNAALTVGYCRAQNGTYPAWVFRAPTIHFV